MARARGGARFGPFRDVEVPMFQMINRLRRRLRRSPEDESYDRKELARLEAEYTGTFVKDVVGQGTGVLPSKFDKR
jgi:hypothetical protein